MRWGSLRIPLIDRDPAGGFSIGTPLGADMPGCRVSRRLSPDGASSPGRGAFGAGAGDSACFQERGPGMLAGACRRTERCVAPVAP